MSEQISFASAEQTAFLNALPETVENQNISGFDSFAPAQFCSPSFFGCKLCIGATVVSGSVALSVLANTPLGGFNKTFKITNNISFSWSPVGVFSVEFKVTNFRKTGGSVTFDASIKGCLKVPILGSKCASFSHRFSIPALSPSAQQSLLRAPEAAQEISDKDYSTLLLLHALIEEKEACNCH